MLRLPPPPSRRTLPRSLWPCLWPSFLSRQARRSWNDASRASLLEQHHLFSSVVSLFALNPLVLPALMLGWILHLSKQASHLPVVRTLLYVAALGWVHAIILAIRSIMPLCVAVVMWTILAHAANAMIGAALWSPLQHSWPGITLLIAAAAEVIFYLLTLRRAQRLQARTTGPELSVPRRWLAYRRVEQSSQFVLPMAMPECCVHWRKFKHLRAAAKAFGAGSKSFMEREGARSSKGVALTAAVHAAEEGVTPSARYLDRSGQPVVAPVLSPSSQRQRHPLDFLRGWFYNVDLRHIKHDNLMAFFAENSMGLHLHELSSKQRAELEDVVSWIQLKLTTLSPAEIRRRHRAKLLRTACTAGRAHDSVVRCDVTQSAPPVICVSPAPAAPASAPAAADTIITAAQFRAGRGSIELPLSAPLVADAKTTPRQSPRHQRVRSRRSTDAASSSTSPSPASSSGSNSPLLPAAPPPQRAASTSPDDSAADEEEEQSLAISPCASRKSSSAAAAESRRRRTAHAEEQLRQQRLIPPSQPLTIPSPSPFLSGNSDSDSSTRAAEDDSAAASSHASSHEPSFSWETHLSQGTLQPGYDPLHPPMSLNLAPVGFVHRPLGIYLGVLGLGALAGAVMRAWGFRHCRTGRITYWYRPASISDAEIMANKPRADPLVLIHGIGIGAFTYLHLLRPLCRTTSTVTTEQRGVYVLELPYISMQLGKDDVPSPAEHVDAMRDMIYEHEMDEREAMEARAAKLRRAASSASSASKSATAPAPSARPSLDSIQQSACPLKILLVSHSYGTFVSTWLVKHQPDMVSAVVLIDPVCFMVYDPTLIYNFIYRTPFSLVTHIYHFFTAKELGISYTLLRHFWWYENILWREEIERLGMTAQQLENSCIAEREMCVAALPYNDIDQGIREEEGDADADADGEGEDETDAVESPRLPQPPQHQSHRRVRSDGSTMFEAAGSGAPDAAALHTPAASSSASASASSAAAVSAFSEHPLCPLRPPGGVRAHVFLASNDDITPSASIHAYLTGAIAIQERKWGKGQAMISCEVFPGIGHAEALFHSGLRRKILATIQGQPSDAELRQKAVSAETERQARSRSNSNGRGSKTKPGCATPM